VTARRWRVVAAPLVLALSACASNPPPPPAGLAPRYPDYPAPVIPATLRPAVDIRDLHDLAWRRLQAGDLGGATRDFSAVLKRAPDFYPSTAGLGFVSLAGRQFKPAVTRFSMALAKNDRYLPAWLGKADAELGLGNDTDAIEALEKILTIDPKRDGVSARLELVRFRRIQTLIESGRKARNAGRLDEAGKTLEEALRLSPTSALILKELAAVEARSGDLDKAEEHLRRVTVLEPTDTEGFVTLAAVLEGRKKYGEAASAWAKAVALDPKPEWRAKVSVLRTKASLEAIPAEFRDTASRAVLTRGEVAAYVGLSLPELLEKAPRRPVTVATDVRSHWASPWIAIVTRAGVMDVYPNHTFQPAATVKRSDLAQIMASLVALAGTVRPVDLARWRAARPTFADLPATNVFYRAAALAVASGALATDRDNRFEPARLATGAELTAAVDRIDEIAIR